MGNTNGFSAFENKRKQTKRFSFSSIIGIGSEWGSALL
jgi:hypothetical protein